MNAYDTLTYSRENGRVEIALNRPDVLNALNRTLTTELNDALDRAHNDDAYVILLSGTGRAFCAGADMNEMGAEDDKLSSGAYLWKVQSIVRKLHGGPLPVVAAVTGPAVGVGCDLALACDLRVLGEGAFLREEFINVGLVPGDGGAWLLPRLVGESKAKEFLLTGQTIDSETALDIGLVVDVVPEDDCLQTARDLADEIVSKPATGVRETKGLIDVTQTFETYAQRAIEAQWECATSDEHAEAVAAYREGRDPEYDR